MKVIFNSHFLVARGGEDWVSFPLYFHLVKVAPDISDLPREIANLLRDNPQGTEIRENVLGAAEDSLAVPFRSTQLLDLDNPAISGRDGVRHFPSWEASCACHGYQHATGLVELGCHPGAGIS